MNIRSIFIFDLDGTLADNTHRAHYLKERPQNWEAFTAACGADTPILPMVELAQQLAEGNAEIHIWTGRTDDVMHETMAWLEKHEVPYDVLLMRPHGDWTLAAVMKGVWLDELTENQRKWLVCAFDDDHAMAEFWKTQGVFCLQVPK